MVGLMIMNWSVQLPEVTIETPYISKDRNEDCQTGVFQCIKYAKWKVITA
jgi:hypothetical protein